MNNNQNSCNKMPVPDYAANVLNILNLEGCESFLVGGCVRDFLMGRKPEDYDITTNARAETIERIFSDYRVIDTGIKHGTVTVLSEGIPVEVTTYRVDGTYSDGRHPDSVNFSLNLTEDLARRDFTMNAVAYSPRDGFVDVYGGREDINARLIRCVGEPDRRFGEDALRILRALRFSSVLGFEIEPKTAASIHRNKQLLKKIAVERITSEFFRLICGQGAARVLREYSDVAAEIMPPLKDIFGFEQCNPHHIYDVWEHTLHVIENVPPYVELRMAALLHDIGKPHCFTKDESGIGHFYGHAEISEKIGCEIFEKYLRTDKKTQERILTLVKNHDETFITNRKIIRRRLIKYGEETFRQLLDLSRGDTLGQSPKFLERLKDIDEAEQILNEVLASDNCLSLKNLAINGRDLSSIGIEQGKIMGDILRALLDEVNDEKIDNQKELLLKRASDLYQNISQHRMD